MTKHAPQASGPRPQTWNKQQRRLREANAAMTSAEQAIGGVSLVSPIFTRPDPVVQRPVNSTSNDRNGWKRHVLGGIVKEKGRR